MRTMIACWGFGHHRQSYPFDGAPPYAIELILRLDRLIELTQLIAKEINVDATKITADIAAQTTVLQGVVTLVTNLQQSNADQTALIKTLQDQIANSDPAAQATLDALDAQVQANTALVNGFVPAAVQNTQTPPAQAQAAVDTTTSSANPAPSADAAPASPAATGG